MTETDGTHERRRGPHGSSGQRPEPTSADRDAQGSNERVNGVARCDNRGGKVAPSVFFKKFLLLCFVTNYCILAQPRPNTHRDEPPHPSAHDDERPRPNAHDDERLRPTTTRTHKRGCTQCEGDRYKQA